LNRYPQAFVNSRATLAGATAATVGSIAWYTQLYGTLPFIGQVHASGLGEEGLHPTALPWSHNGWFDSFDHTRFVL
jgi:ubiquinol-cytochrome c reductase cytochrome c1 subunit